MIAKRTFPKFGPSTIFRTPEGMTVRHADAAAHEGPLRAERYYDGAVMALVERTTTSTGAVRWTVEAFITGARGMQ
jgi:hypothetical protein